jgi:hypothetical protein
MLQIQKKTYVEFFSINPTRRTNFPNFILSKNSTCFRHFLCPSSGVFYCTFDIGIFLAGLMTASCILLVSLKRNLLRYTVTWTYSLFRVAKKIYVKFGCKYILVKSIQKKNLHTQDGTTMCCNLVIVIRTTKKFS